MASLPAHAACWSLPAAGDAEPKAWVLHDGKPGLRSQALGLAEIADALAALLSENGGSLLLTPSRRTGERAITLLRARLGGFPGAIWDGGGDNPYFAYLALADALLVTADSVSMISEAAATGKPVHILDLDGGNAKFSRFHAAMRGAGITRPFSGRIESWSYPIRDDTARAGAALRALVLTRIGGAERA